MHSFVAQYRPSSLLPCAFLIHLRLARIGIKVQRNVTTAACTAQN
jgi:hypothetical protein